MGFKLNLFNNQIDVVVTQALPESFDPRAPIGAAIAFAEEQRAWAFYKTEIAVFEFLPIQIKTTDMVD